MFEGQSDDGKAGRGQREKEETQDARSSERVGGL